MRRISPLLVVLVAAFVTEPAFADREIPDISGKWAQVQVTTSVAKIPLIGEVESRTISLFNLWVRQTGEDLRIDTQTCDIRIDSDFKKVRAVIPDAMVRSLPEQTRRAKLEKRKQGYHLVLKPTIEVLGAKLDKPAREALPTKPGDPRVRDQDRDGKPGVTIKMTGLIDGNVYLVQRNWSSMKGAVSADEVTGRIRWKTEQSILDATSMFLRKNPNARPSGDPSASWFKMVRVPDSTSCQDIVKDHQQLLGI